MGDGDPELIVMLDLGVVVLEIDDAHPRSRLGVVKPVLHRRSHRLGVGLGAKFGLADDPASALASAACWISMHCQSTHLRSTAIAAAPIRTMRRKATSGSTAPRSADEFGLRGTAPIEARGGGDHGQPESEPKRSGSILERAVSCQVAEEKPSTPVTQLWV